MSITLPYALSNFGYIVTKDEGCLIIFGGEDSKGYAHDWIYVIDLEKKHEMRKSITECLMKNIYCNAYYPLYILS